MDIETALETCIGTTRSLKDDPYNVQLFNIRMQAYRSLGFPDLAAMDAYKMILLIDEVMDDSGEYHEQAMESLCNHIASQNLDERLQSSSSSNELLGKLKKSKRDQDTPEVDEEEAQNWCRAIYAPIAPACLSECLLDIGCIRPAWTYVLQALRDSSPGSDHFTHASTLSDRILEQARVAMGLDSLRMGDVNVESLPYKGSVRREVYPWNDHEADRMSPTAVQFLNDQMIEVAPKLEVALTELPALTAGPEAAKIETVKQLGVFAREKLMPGEEILRERSLLTANNKLHEPMCDACSTILPDFTKARKVNEAEQDPVPCPECMDTIFCSQECLDLAQDSYHASICGADIDSISRDVPAKETADALYTLLLLRALAMALTQEVHPLDLKEVKYIWGDFNPTPHSSSSSSFSASAEPPRTLPWTFEANILTPLHLLESLDVNIFTTPFDLAETWVYNTLYAKFRGTASARLNPRDGRPEVAAVHPLWCLANHSCDPNVEWEWAGEIRFFARKERVKWHTQDGKSTEGGAADDSRENGAQPFIKKGEELLNHYVDVDLPVKERREWGLGALGGPCMCERCQAESGEAEQ